MASSFPARRASVRDAVACADEHRLGAVLVERPGGAYDHVELAWPWYLPWGSFLGASFTLIEALRHRAVEWGSDSLVVAAPLAVVALLPFLLDAFAHAEERLVIHRLPWALLAMVPTIALLVHSPTNDDFAPFLLVLASIQVGATASATRLAVAIVAAACGALIALDLLGEFDGVGVWVVGNLAALAGGVAVRKSVEALTHEAAVRAAQVERAALDERQRIAREIHDVIAHSLSVTMLHLTGARRALETDRDLDDAVEALRDAELLGRQAMSDIRRTVGLLGADNGNGHVPAPGAEDIAALVEGFRAVGLDVANRLEGDAGGVSPAVGLGLYRIVQESLTNAARHAPGAAVTVDVAVCPEVVTVVVANGPATSSTPIDFGEGGLGLEGMRDRATLLGGTLRAGPDATGWRVWASIPRGGAAPESP